MEGVGGAASPVDVLEGATSYDAVRVLWMAEVNAVAEALFESGAAEVVVTDAHGSGHNLHLDGLDPRIALIHGRSRTFGMLEGIDGDVDAVVFLGYHGTAGSGGVLSHAFMPVGIHSLLLDDEPAGEGSVNAVLARYFGVPIVMVTGDDVACTEAARYAPEAPRVAVKQALSRYCSRNRPRGVVDAELRAAATAAVRGAQEWAAPPPIAKAPTLEVEFSTESCALAVSAIPGVVRAGQRSVFYKHDDVPTWYRAVGAMWTLARAAQDPSYG
jgi:D-amino peptidase